jgi:hypothetical protein
MPDRSVPRDIIPSFCAATCHPQAARTTSAALHIEQAPEADEAAEDLRTLCETLVSRIPAADVADFVTEQVPAPRSALALACMLQLSDTDDAARFWWQYAWGAGQGAAAYCLYLHHLAQGEEVAAEWWHQQTSTSPPPSTPATQPAEGQAPPGREAPQTHHEADPSTAMLLRMVRHLVNSTSRRPHSSAVTRLMSYLPTAVTVGYLREPDMDIPLPGPEFADRVSALLATSDNHTASATDLPTRQPRPRRSQQVVRQ